jgi:Ser/Thr protein kinase RdoA (MazF antagonist)
MSRTPAILLTDFPDRDDVAREALLRWPGDPSTLEHIATGASFTYRFASGANSRYLRLMPPGWRTVPELHGELAFIDHVAAKGVAAARPIASKRGDRIEQVETSRGAWLALVFRAIDGDSSDDEYWSAEQAREAGRLMARMHLAAQDFELPQDAERPTWRDEFTGLEGELPRDESELWRIIERARGLFDRLPQSRDCYGMVHFDLSGDNLIWQELSPTAIDFDDCMWHWYAGDIARTVAYLRMTDGGEVGPREAAFTAGYEQVRRLDTRWRDLLPEFLRLALISELAWMRYSSGSGSTVFTAEQEANLRLAIERYRG